MPRGLRAEASHAHAHAGRLKQLVGVNFTPVHKGATADTLKRDRNDRWMCPGCVKTLANNPKLSGTCAVSCARECGTITDSPPAVLQKCGHVVCQSCVKTFVEKDNACVKCNAAISAKDVIVLVTEGTGFAASGEVEAKRFSTPFTA